MSYTKCTPVFIKSKNCCFTGTAITIEGTYGVTDPQYPLTPIKGDTHTVLYDDKMVIYTWDGSTWVESVVTPIVTDTDTRVEFSQVLPNGNWEFNIIDVVNNTVLSTFEIPGHDYYEPDGLTVITTSGTGILSDPFIFSSWNVVDNQDNTYTFTSPDGSTTFTIDNRNWDIVDNGDNTYTFTSPDGSTVFTVDTNTVPSNTITAGNNVLITSVNNPDGSITYTINGCCLTYSNGVLTILNPDGTSNIHSLLSTDVDNVAEIGSDGGLKITCQIINDCVVTQQDINITNPNTGLVETIPAGTDLQTALETISNWITTLEISLVDGQTSWDAINLILTITESDGTNPILVDFKPLISKVESDSLSGITVTPTVNPDGSTTYTITFDMCQALSNVTDNGNTTLTTDKVLVKQNSGDCEIKSIRNDSIDLLCDPAGNPVFRKEIEGVITFVNNDDTPYIGDINLLTICDCDWYEERICINDRVADVSTVFADINNPTIAEVQAWVQANLTLKQRLNGTQVVYFVEGDGGSCDEPDFVWVLNKGSELITQVFRRDYYEKRAFIKKDGNDAQYRIGYREYPATEVSTIDLTEDDITVEVYKGEYDFTGTNYTNTVTCENLVKTGNKITYILNPEVYWRFNDLNKFGFRNDASTLNTELNILGYGNLILDRTNPNPGNISAFFGNTKTTQEWNKYYYNGIVDINANGFNFKNEFTDIRVKDVIATNLKGYNGIFNVGRVDGKGTFNLQRFSLNIDNVYVEQNELSLAAPLFTCEIFNHLDVPDLQVNLDINVGNINISGLGNAATWVIHTDNLKYSSFNFNCKNLINTTVQDFIVNPAYPAQIGDYDDYYSLSVTTRNPEIHIGSNSYKTESLANRNCTFNYNFDNIVTGNSIVGLHGTSAFENTKYNIKVANGISTVASIVIVGPSIDETSSMVVEGNYTTTGDDPVVLLAYMEDVYANKSKPVEIKNGTLKTLGAGKETIQIGNVYPSTLDFNNAIVLENVTLINDGTVPNIGTNLTTPITVICKNVYMNSTLNDPNINLVGTFYQNAIYGN